ncbi:hypothetical protein F4808DRAFT_412267 [Astrocystis sublimbata]|nr:hypothetical protein F4808DRAFT_412267 [Astrocystis sublimbata]
MEELSEMPEQYYTHDGRVASFYPPKPAARRGSNAKGKAPKPLSWPHSQLDPEVFARAGFYFAPDAEFPDNTVCFLCHKNMGGWEDDDNPFVEHLRLSPRCGWAIVAGIETGLGDYSQDDPTGSDMIAARKETFGDRWPHDGKRGWKCKTKQLVDAGWKYTPTMDSDDMATCAYCQLALDGWEPKDNPMDEHYRRSPDCPFFTLMNQYKAAAPAKKKGRGKAVRSSKAQRLSTQSAATAASEAPSLLEHSADHDDSVLTTTSVMTQGGTKRPRAKKATTAKGKKSRAKKEEVVEVLEDPEEDAQSEHAEEPQQAEIEEVAPKPARGRKRTSAAVEDSVLTTAEAPPPKKRAARGRVASASAKTQKPDTDHAMFDPSPPEVDDAVVDAELQALEAEMEVELEQKLQVPKKGRQAGVRKASKQTTKKTKAKAPVEPTPQPEPELIVDPDMDELAEDHNTSTVSNGTVVRTSISSTTAPRKRGRPSKKSLLAQAEVQAQVRVEARQEPPAQQDTEHEHEPEPEAEIEDVDMAEPEPEPEPEHQSEAEPEPELSFSEKVAKVTKILPPSRDKSLPPPPPESDSESEAEAEVEAEVGPQELEPPTTPKALISPAPAARQAAVSPSQSPQSSDAENQPPSSKPSNTSKSTRVALEPVATTTPVRSASSPSKRNIIAGLQTTTPWSAVDVELIFDDLDQENALSTGKFLKSGMELSTPEQTMTVEEWIYHNAEQAEKKLKHECETIVMAFEKEGTRAMKALEGIVVESQ